MSLKDRINFGNVPTGGSEEPEPGNPEMKKDPGRKSRWYFGGLASMGAACCTHPLDLIKVHLQTGSASATSEKRGIAGAVAKVYRTDGIRGFYSGLTASLLRQASYSTTRFAIYDILKNQISPNGEAIAFPVRLAMAATAGFCGGVLGNPGDMINVRMQNDMKLPADVRRNYKNAVDGVLRVAREEGPLKLFNGVEWASSRAVMVTVGQLCFYDVIKAKLLTFRHFEDNIKTHLASSFIAGSIATALAQPVDVLKTRAQNSAPGEFRSPLHLVMYTARQGPLTFFKGFVPALTRLGPHTILTFIFFEQLRLHFGSLPTASAQETKT